MISDHSLPHSLTEKGRGQAEALACKLRDMDIQRLYSSPIPRAVETAQILSARLGLPFEVTEALRECNCGVLDGRGDAEAWAIHKAVYEDWVLRNRWEARFEGGESKLDVKARFVPFIEDLVARYGGEPGNIALISHGGLYWCMLPHLLVNFEMGYATAHAIGNTSMIVAEPRPEGLVCLEWCGFIPGAGTRPRATTRGAPT